MVTVQAPPAHVIPADYRWLNGLLATNVPPVEPPAWWCNPSADYRMSPQDAAELAEYEAWLDDQAVSADYDERAARVAEELDLTPAGADCLGFCLGGIESPRELVYEPEAGVMFLDQPFDQPDAPCPL